MARVPFLRMMAADTGRNNQFGTLPTTASLCALEECTPIVTKMLITIPGLGCTQLCGLEDVLNHSPFYAGSSLVQRLHFSACEAPLKRRQIVLDHGHCLGARYGDAAFPDAPVDRHLHLMPMPSPANFLPPAVGRTMPHYE